MTKAFYAEWERLRRREREEIRRAGRIQTDAAWARWRKAAMNLREHERAFELDFAKNTCC